MKLIPILSGKALILEESGPYKSGSIELPEGNWQIVGRLSEVSHSDLCYSPFLSDIKPIYKGLRFHIETVFSDGHRNDFKDGIQALDSAIRAEGLIFENPHQDPKHLKIDKDNKPFSLSDWYEQKELEYEQAQSRVLDRSRCLLLRRVDG